MSRLNLCKVDKSWLPSAILLSFFRIFWFSDIYFPEKKLYFFTGISLIH